MAPVKTGATQDYVTGKEAYKRGDYEIALEHFVPLAQRGHAESQANLGYMYSHGLGVLRDYKQSLRWLREAAVQNDAHAQHNLGVLHGNGLGVPTDHFLAYLWFNLAAANGHKTSGIKRDLAALRLSPGELLTAKGIVRKCLINPMSCHKYSIPGKSI